MVPDNNLREVSQGASCRLDEQLQEAPMRGLAQLVPAALIALSVGACATHSGPQEGPLPPSSSEASVKVTNNNWADMNVYVERSGMRVRLGTVTSMGSRLFRVPRSVVNATGDIRLVADPIGSRDVHVTAPVQVWPGQTVDFRIENHIAISSVAIWQ
jgi:hypothetical protein